MELRTLQYFLAVTKEENITRAAESLHISQPYLSKQLMELENEFGKQLLIRGKRKITLTENGITISPRCTAHFMQIIAGCTLCFSAIRIISGIRVSHLSSGVVSRSGRAGLPIGQKPIG